MIFGTGNARIWELSANYDDPQEFYKAVMDHEVSGVTDKEYKACR